MSSTKPMFAGSIIANYDRYLVPLIFEEYSQDLAARAAIPTGGRVLELACGTGVLTRHLSAALPIGATLVATDISPTMVDATQNRVAHSGHGTIEYKTADGTNLPFDDDRFDVVSCQFGVMFYADKRLGYREAARVLKSGGSFVFNVWDAFAENTFCRIVHETVVALQPDDPPAFLSGPFGYYDLETIKSELQASGFDEVAFSVLPGTSRASSARDVAMALVAGTPLATQLAERGIEQAAFVAVEKALVHEFGSGEVTAPMQSIAIMARTGPGP